METEHIHDEQENHHQAEKESVIQKVKDKAKKILKKRGDESDDEDKETMNIHDPLYESGFISGTSLPKQTGLDMDRPIVSHEENPHITDSVTVLFPNSKNRVTNFSDQYNTNIREEVDSNEPIVVQDLVEDSLKKNGDNKALNERLDNLHVRDEIVLKYSELPKSFDPAKPESMPRDTIAETISVMAEKASSAKNVVASKLGYGGQDKEESSKYEDGSGGRSACHSDKGVSIKEYLAEKLSPGEEDKALSEAIMDVIHSKKGGIWKKEEGRDAETSGGGVVGRVKGRVSSWLGMSSGSGTQTQGEPNPR